MRCPGDSENEDCAVGMKLLTNCIAIEFSQQWFVSVLRLKAAYDWLKRFPQNTLRLKSRIELSTTFQADSCRIVKRTDRSTVEQVAS